MKQKFYVVLSGGRIMRQSADGDLVVPQKREAGQLFDDYGQAHNAVCKAVRFNRALGFEDWDNSHYQIKRLEM